MRGRLITKKGPMALIYFIRPEQSRFNPKGHRGHQRVAIRKMVVRLSSSRANLVKNQLNDYSSI